MFQPFSFFREQTYTPITNLQIEYLMVAGGGSGARDTSGQRNSGGGGAGGLISGSATLDLTTTYPIVIGIRANRRTSDGNGFVGGNTTFNGLTASGGGGGGTLTGGNGGSGGGGGTSTGGAGTSGQGYGGGDGNSSYNGGGGGGGGAAGFGQVGGSTPANGGLAAASSITGTSVYYASGGPERDGAYNPSKTTYGAGGKSNAGDDTEIGTSGVVIIRYLGSQKATGGTITSSGGYTIHTFSSDGNFITD